MQLEIVKSGLIAAVGYDAEKEILFVSFHKNKKQTENPTYTYHPFSLARWAEFKEEQTREGGSVGKYFLQFIKPDTTLAVARMAEGDETETGNRNDF
jgi:KTSC domain